MCPRQTHFPYPNDFAKLLPEEVSILLDLCILKCLVQDDNDLQRITVSKHHGENNFPLLWNPLKCEAKGRMGMLSFSLGARREVCLHMGHLSTSRCIPYLAVLEF